MKNSSYGSLLNRIKAVIVDGVVLMGLGLVASFILGKFNNVPDWIRFIIFIFIFLLYDPLFTSLLGGTIGHFIIGLRVRRNNDETKKILFPIALVRFIFKALLGFISLLTVPGNKKKEAIHDSIAGSVVIQAE